MVMVEETILNFKDSFPDTLRQEAERFLGIRLKLGDRLKSADSYSYRLNSDACSYVGKIYRFEDWPPKGKTQLVHNLLDENHIPHEQIIYENNQHTIFKFGWQISKFIPGGTVREGRSAGVVSDQEYFPKIGALLSKVHKIKLQNYGSLTEKGRQFSTFRDYTEKELEDLHFDALPKEFAWARGVINEAINFVRQDLQVRNFASPVLLHDDVNEGNVMWNNGSPLLIDWTDSLAGPAVRDFATMTFRADASIIGFIEQGYGEKIDLEELKVHQILRFIRLGRFYFLEDKNPEELEKMMTRLQNLLGRPQPYGV